VDGDWGMGGVGIGLWEGARGNRKTTFFPVVIKFRYKTIFHLSKEKKIKNYKFFC